MGELKLQFQHSQFQIIPVTNWKEKKSDISRYFKPERNLFTRLAANLIDYAIIAIIIFPFYFYIDQVFYALSGGPYTFTPQQEKYELFEFILKSLTILSVWSGYYYFLYKFKATTLGKRYFNLSTYRYKGHEPIGLIRIFLREIIFKFLALIVFPATIIHFLLQEEGLFIHDVLTRTIVVRETH